ncbi:hypothetical protein [Stutzerimonas nitrititolerans]|uniref:hypothetical protein n=1 Tax=Stutzerimonas nitrititolerans TaxID=2482751 RepID=UPI00289E2397|nr:hypothetical protein [Stutzerimonas nitrititolerans]
MSKEVKRFIASLEGGFVEVIEARDYDALLEENKLLSATQYGSGRMQALRDERDALLAERDAMAKDAERWRHARSILTVDAIETAQSEYIGFGFPPAESESVRADQAIDAAMQGAQP